MNEQSQGRDQMPPEPTLQDVVALIKKTQEQLAALERKMDAFLNRPQERSFGRKPFGQKRFSKPYRPFGRPHHGPHREDDGGHGEKKHYGEGHHFQRRHGGKNAEFEHKKKPFYHRYRKG